MTSQNLERPKKVFSYVERREGKYNWANPYETQVQYCFFLREDAPKEMKREFLVDLDKDYSFCGTALEVAQEILAVYEPYFIHTGKDKIKALIEYLESIEEQDAKDELAYKIAEAEYQISYWRRERDKFADRWERDYGGDEAGEPAIVGANGGEQ